MKSINEMSVLDFQTKFGEIKCNANELRFLLYLVEKMNKLICGQFWGDLTEKEQEEQEKNLDYVEYFQNRYLYLPSLRYEEKFNFDIMKSMSKKLNSCKDEEEEKAIAELLESYKKSYLNSREERKNIAEELDKIKTEKYSGNFWFI